MRLWIVGILAACVCHAAPDTVRLASQLRAVRGYMKMSDPEFRKIQQEYLAWLDARVKRGEGVAGMNRELKAAELLPNWTDDLDDMDKSHAGYLQPIKRRDVKDTLVFEAGIYLGGGCSLDVTAAVYEQGTMTKLAAIHAAAGAAYYLSGLDVGARDPSGRRLIATGWVASNCTSSWNGKYIRIDRLERTSLKNLLARDLAAHDRDPSDTVAVHIQDNVVTFDYDGVVGDPDLLWTPAMARYRVVDGHPVREAPIALTRAGFIHEWLNMKDADPARWGEPQAVQMRPAVAASLERQSFEWAGAAQCGLTPPVWEVGVRLSDPAKLYFFRIGGARVGELRMLAIGEKQAASCVPVDLTKGLMDVAAELPR